MRMRHGYTNETERIGELVVKTYVGPDTVDRQTREVRGCRALGAGLPVPEIVHCHPGRLTTRWVEGVPAQELLGTEAMAERVLSTCGRLLADLQSVPVTGVVAGDGDVHVHGDFGPNNLLLDAGATHVRLLCDWEWYGVGPRLTDLAWCEWIVRMHHPEQIPLLDAFFESYGSKPPWRERQLAMVERVSRHLDFSRRWPGAEHVSRWEDRLALTANWQE